MERLGYIRPMQGGVTGSGFEVPGSVLYDEPRAFQEVATKIAVRAKHTKQACGDADSRSQVQLWTKEAMRRLFTLYTLRNKSTSPQIASISSNDASARDCSSPTDPTRTAVAPCNRVRTAGKCISQAPTYPQFEE